MAKAMKSAKKSVKKADSRFYIVRTMQEARGELKDKGESYKKKYIAKPVKMSKEFVEDLKDDPRNVIEDFIDDGKEFIEDFKTESRDKIDEFMGDGKSFFKRIKKNPRKVMDELMDDSRDFVSELKNDTRDMVEGYMDDGKDVFEGIEKDVRLIFDDFISNGKKAFKKYPMKKTIEKTINSRMKSVPSRFNMPSKKEI
ncbi:MAG: hypothetical protein JRF40_08425, partial [Deltaproteobacteria bacterium]|nr:hypothetical protein [Deltaproteobacteria bacterium]